MKPAQYHLQQGRFNVEFALDAPDKIKKKRNIRDFNIICVNIEKLTPCQKW